MKSSFFSVFSILGRYFVALYKSFTSITTAVKATLPYLIGSRSRDVRREITEQYPDPVSSRTPEDLPARSRGHLFNDIEKCTGCGDCEKVCPVNCISIETEMGPDPQKTWVAVFDIDQSRCVYCGLCTDVCPPQSIVNTHQFEGAVYQLEDLVMSFGRGRVTFEQRQKWDEMRRVSQLEEPNL